MCLNFTVCSSNDVLLPFDCVYQDSADGRALVHVFPHLCLIYVVSLHTSC